jgi:hypothetical protein
MKLLALEPTERPSANEVLLAMKSETNFDNITKGNWATSRVQNLDSPVPPGPPIAGKVVRYKSIIRHL